MNLFVVGVEVFWKFVKLLFIDWLVLFLFIFRVFILGNFWIDIGGIFGMGGFLMVWLTGNVGILLLILEFFVVRGSWDFWIGIVGNWLGILEFFAIELFGGSWVIFGVLIGWVGGGGVCWLRKGIGGWGYFFSIFGVNDVMLFC